ncbi:Cytochrome p450 family protein [Lasiodiplodia theobromae]|uniref:Cytochrome p450 family protein n=1 Tax=Lasiodiplodia theobromae TaxID=45133 RepID=UPI0015C384A3|nr:Cytochrome p450 family protein [Lasiodiplodia theobromae]KAF4542619.1 Cytochrome p450 family protein [Lasiodiplodia theobromae]
MLSTSLFVCFVVPAGLAVLAAVTFLLPPRNFPKNIPTIPFWYTLLPLFRDCDQETLYREYLEEPLKKYGAVNIFFASRWNVLVQRPELLQEVFKNEDLYAKSGNQKKIPYSVIADYTGDNVISAHGADWRLYRSVVAPGLQRDFDTEPVVRNANLLASLFAEQQKKSARAGVLVLPLLQRLSLENVAQSLLGTHFGTLESPQAPMHQMQMTVKREIFKPLFLNFPFLDRFPIPSRQRARQLVDEFASQLCTKVLESHQHAHDEKMANASAGCHLVQAYKSELLTEQQFRHNVSIILIAGHENPQLLFQSLLFLLGQHEKVQRRIREEVAAVREGGASAILNIPYLMAVVYETLRMYPPISQLINRCTTAPTVLGGNIALPAGAYVGYNGYSTGHDKAFWGEDADEFKPERWGATMEEINTTFRTANRKCGFIAFHGGKRACLGQKFAMLEARLTVAVLVERLTWRLDPTWRKRMTPAGPLSPMLLRLFFEER